MSDVKVTGIEKVISNLKKYQIIKRQRCEDKLKKGGFKVELAAKEMCPVRYGRARASITTNWSGSGIYRMTIKNPCRAPENPTDQDDAIGEPTGPKGLVTAVGTNVKYAPWLEHGTPSMPARPFLHPAFFMYEGEIVKDLAKVMGKDEKIK